MPAEYLLLETGDRLLLESGDGLLLESSTVDQTVALPLVDDSTVLAPLAFAAGSIALPLIDDGETLPPLVFEDKTVDLPLVDDSAVLAPGITLSGGVDLPLVDDAATFGPSVFVAQQSLMPLIDGGETFAPSFVQAQQLDLRFLDGGWPFGPTVEGQVTAGLQVYAGATLLTEVLDPSFRDPIDDIGSFSLTLANDDPQLALVDFEAVVRFEVDGRPVFQGIVRNRSVNHLAPGEEVDHVTTVTGPGYLGVATRDVVGPSRGVGSLPIEEVRSWSWPTPDFDDSSWPFAKKVNRQRDYATWRAPLPWIWPDTTGWWIWANLATVNANFAPAGVCLFRKSFTLASETRVRIFCAADNHLRLWVDGAEMTSFSSFTTGRYVEVVLSAGTHYLAAKVNNDIKADLPNPGGLIAAVYSIGDAGLLDDLITHTDATWRCLPYPTLPPGFTPGDVLYELRAETDIFDGTGFDFTRTLDSDGEPWDEFTEITTQVGRRYAELLREMAVGLIDVAAAPGASVIRAWNKRTRGVDRTATATLTQTLGDPDQSEFLQLAHTGAATRANYLLIRYAGGHTELDLSGVTDRVGAYLELGSVRSEAEAQRYGRRVMDRRSLPAYSTTARLLPSPSGPQPYRDFEPGDTVMCLNESGDLEAMRVMGIMLDPDQVGVLEWGVELRDIELEMEELHQNWLRRAAEGHAVGGARVASPAGTPEPISQQITDLRAAEFSYDNAQLTVSSSPKRAAEVSGNIVEVQGTLTTAGSTSTVVVAELNGTAIATLTFAAGETETEEPVVILPVKANLDKLQVSITTAGSGAEGLDVQVRAI